MAPKSSKSIQAKERRREQNRLAQRRFREKNSQHKTIGHEPVGAPNLNPISCPETQIANDSLPTTPTISQMASMSPPTEGCDTSMDAVNTAMFLDSFDFCATNTIFPSHLDSVGPMVQLTPAESDSAVQLPKSPQDSQSATFTDDCSGGEAIHCYIGGDTTRKGNSHNGNTLGKQCTTPLQRAVQMGHGKIIRLLLEHHADSNEKDSEGKTPLINATIAGFEDVVDLLLSHGAGIEYVDHQHRSALHWAVIHRQDRLLKRLLRHCAGNSKLINEITKDGRTPLLIAIDAGFDAAVEALLESGAAVQ
ncbi:hypothetical protein FE257_000898 [Aspergillus nanangensis]|uniref:BZIP domain-containing protein n=1 Tax=Aspergillus nanangensis TaxID=2582783 RepID=A0AAD4GPW5_ASPNN|nr:hypothetical protein FE257_000898 [Aspergillus nanangensis]